MQHSTKRSQELSKLIRSFEQRIQSGTLIYLEEKETLQILDYYEEEGMLDHAIKVVELAINQNPYRTEYHLLKSRIYYRMEKKKTALKTIEDALNYSPMEYELLFMKARILTDFMEFAEANEIITGLKIRSHGIQKTHLLLLEAYSYELQRDYDKMYKTIKETVIYTPTSHLALMRMWVAVEITKNYSDSVEIHEGILDINPYNHLAWFNLGHAYACLGRYEEAINALEYSFLIEPEFDAAYSDCAEICLQVGRNQQSLEIQLEQLQRFGMESNLLVEIAENLITLHRYTESFKYLFKARSLDAYNDEVYYNLARAYALDGNYPMVIKQLKKAIDIEKRREEYYGLIADAYAHTQAYANADYYYRKATETGPEDPRYWLAHIKFLLSIDEYQAALNVVEESYYHTYSIELECARVFLFFQCGMKKKAIGLLEEIARDEDFSSDILFAIAPELKSHEQVRSILNYYMKEK